jgi:hypothetical protein
MGWEDFHLDGSRYLGQIYTSITMGLSASIINMVKALLDIYISESITITVDLTKHGHIHPEATSYNAIQ